MLDTVPSNIRLFEDDMIMYLILSIHSDCHSKLICQTWKNESVMVFNPDKCEVIRVTKKKKKKKKNKKKQQTNEKKKLFFNINSMTKYYIQG